MKRKEKKNKHIMKLCKLIFIYAKANKVLQTVNKLNFFFFLSLFLLFKACRTPTRDSKGVSLLFRYYNLLYYVERRFFSSERNVSIFFEWYDSLTGKRVVQTCVLYFFFNFLSNIGNILSALNDAFL